MINSKSSTHGLLAAALMAASVSGISLLPAAQTAARRRASAEEEMARQKRLALFNLTYEQRAWNEAIEAKRIAKKGKAK